MAITTAQLVLTQLSGTAVGDSVLHQVFTAGKVGDAATYVFLEVRNTSTVTYTTPKVWVTVDAGGGLFAVALGQGTVVDVTATWALPDAAGLTYSTPTTYAGGLALPLLTAGTKALICVRRDLTAASEAHPEINRLNVYGTSPL